MANEKEKGADVGIPLPKKGDKFRCAQCGMQVEVTADCRCDKREHVHFHCCNKEMAKA